MCRRPSTVPNRQSDRFVVNPVDALRDLAQCLAHRTHSAAVIWPYYWARSIVEHRSQGPGREKQPQKGAAVWRCPWC